MTKKLYIHIGYQKTATSSIQKVLYENQEILKNYNLTYFSLRPDEKQSLDYNVGTWLGVFEDGVESGANVTRLAKKLAEKLSEIDSNVVISAERFSWVFLKSELINFKAELDKYFDEIQIILYLRRQDQQLVSFYNLAAKHNRSPASLFFGYDPVAIPEYKKHFDLYFDYHQRLNSWADVFGQENILVRVFDKNTLLNGNAVDDFLNILGVSGVETATFINKSFGFTKTKVGHLMNQLDIPNNNFRDLVIKNLPNNEKFQPSRKDAEAFYLRYRESNIQLNKEFNVVDNDTLFNEDFSMYPDISHSDLWTEDTANDAIKSSLSSLYGLYGSIDYHSLFNAAVKLEKSDIKLSYQLMELLNQLLPKEKIVKAKLDSYKEYIGKSL